MEPDPQPLSNSPKPQDPAAPVNPTNVALRMRQRVQARRTQQPEWLSRAVTGWLVLTGIAILNSAGGPASTQGFNLWLLELPTYVVCGLLIREMAAYIASIIRDDDHIRREAVITKSVKVRNPRCYALIMAAKLIFVRCIMGMIAAGYAMIVAFYAVHNRPASMELAELHALFSSALMFGFTGAFVLFTVLPIIPLILHLFDFVQAQPDLTGPVPGRPLPGTPAARRWVLGLRRITGFILYGFFGWLVFSGGCAALNEGLRVAYVCVTPFVRSLLDCAPLYSLLSAEISLLIVIPLTLLQFVLVAVCFCRFSLRGIFLLQFVCAALVTAAIQAPDLWKVVPIMSLLMLLTYSVFYVISQDPENTLYLTPDFVRQRMIQRRQVLRERAKAQTLYDAQLHSHQPADKPAANG